MRPLSSQDILNRQTPVDQKSWDADETQIPSGPIRLERFQQLEQILRNHPANPQPYLELSRIYLADQRWNDAKRILDRAAEQFADEEEVQHLREDAQLARSLQLVHEAEKEYQAEPTILTQEAVARAKVELNAVREKVCRARLARHPEQVELLVPLGTALRELGKFDDAIEVFRQAISTPELRADAALQLGELFAQQKKIPEALAEYRRAALFRVPAPTTDVQLKALRAAAELAEKFKLVDSARRYINMLLMIEPNNQALQQKAASLREMPL